MGGGVMPERGDLVQIVWLDILSDGRADPDEIQLYQQPPHYALYWGERVSQGIDCIITVPAMPAQDNRTIGADIYPKSCVKSLTVVKKCRRATRRKKEAPHEVQDPT